MCAFDMVRDDSDSCAGLTAFTFVSHALSTRTHAKWSGTGSCWERNRARFHGLQVLLTTAIPMDRVPTSIPMVTPGQVNDIVCKIGLPAASESMHRVDQYQAPHRLLHSASRRTSRCQFGGIWFTQETVRVVRSDLGPLCLGAHRAFPLDPLGPCGHVVPAGRHLFHQFNRFPFSFIVPGNVIQPPQFMNLRRHRLLGHVKPCHFRGSRHNLNFCRYESNVIRADWAAARSSC